MREHLGLEEAAAAILRAIESVTDSGRILTPDMRGKAKTSNVTDAIIAALP